MCLAVPGILIELDGARGVVDLLGARREIRLDLIETPSLGDYLLIHAGFAIEKIDADRAQDIIQAIHQTYGEPEAVAD